MTTVAADTAVLIKDIHKSFRLPHEGHNGIKQFLINRLKGRKGYETQHVLKGVSFEIKKGDFFGIVGRNGSGKSTLLKLIADIYTPDQGTVVVNGTLTPFIELGVGFNPELTGRENVYMNGALLGMSRREVDIIYDDIVSFAELEKFMDQKLKNYSSGMQVRLAFSIAIRSKSEILLFDEVLAVGDAAFQQKCYEVFANMKEAGKTIILVTHDMGAVQRFCKKALMISNGEVILVGDPIEIADRYLEQNLNTQKKKNSDKISDKIPQTVTDVAVLSGEVPKKLFSTNEKVTTSFKLSNPSNQASHIGFQVFSSEGVYVFGTNSMVMGIDPFVGKSEKINIELDQNLGPGTYHINLAVMNKNATKVLRYIPKVADFNIKQINSAQGGVVSMVSKWSRE